MAGRVFKNPHWTLWRSPQGKLFYNIEIMDRDAHVEAGFKGCMIGMNVDVDDAETIEALERYEFYYDGERDEVVTHTFARKGGGLYVTVSLPRLLGLHMVGDGGKLLADHFKPRPLEVVTRNGCALDCRRANLQVIRKRKKKR